MASYYDILRLTRSNLDTADDPAQTLKRAYRRALLRHHPDKQTPTPQPQHQQPACLPPRPQSFTVDQISTALAVLSDPHRRAAYDRTLRLGGGGGSSGSHSPATSGLFQTGVEIVDLDDLSADGARWFRPCRCGNPRGYAFDEADLEEAADLGELMVGCRDCSLWLRVHFAVVEEDEHGDEHEHEGERGAGRGAWA